MSNGMIKIKRETFDKIMRWISEGKDNDFIHLRTNLRKSLIEEFRSGEIPSSVEITL